MQPKNLLILGLLAVLLAACAIPAKQSVIDTVPKTSTELIYNDMLSTNFSAMNLTVLGISIGMSENDTLNRIGPADKVNEFNFGAIKNWEYAERIGLNDTGVMYHFENGVVTRILVLPPMNKYLLGTSKVGKSKLEIYSSFGIPQRQYNVPKARFFVYNNQGLEVYLRNDTEYQYSFVHPMRKLPTMAYTTLMKNQNDVLTVQLPALLTDTTTLCDQGPTSGTDPVTKECKAFVNSCVIPDDWIEVKNCVIPTNTTNSNTTNTTIAQ